MGQRHVTTLSVARERNVDRRKSERVDETCLCDEDEHEELHDPEPGSVKEMPGRLDGEGRQAWELTKMMSTPKILTISHRFEDTLA